MKEMNKDLIRDVFVKGLKATSAQLSQETGLSTVTVNALLKEMLENKEVFEGESIPSNGGRPSMVYHYNSQLKCAAVIYAFSKNNQDSIHLVVTDLLGKGIYREEQVFETITATSFDAMLDKVFEKYPMIKVIGFGLPGAEEGGTITISDYRSIVGDTFMKHYRERYNVPIFFVNDINAAVNGYYSSTVNNEFSNTVVGIFFPRVYTPGAGVVIKGKIYTGAANFAGEIGNMPIDINWCELDYKEEESVAAAIGKVLAIISCILAPSCFVLYGDFWQTNSRKKIRNEAEKLLQNNFKVNIILSHDFAKDYELGMIKVALEELKNKDEEFSE